LVRVEKVDSIKRPVTDRTSGWRFGCRIPFGFQERDRALSVEILLQQLADKEQSAVNRRRIVTAWARKRFANLTVGLLLKVAASVASENCHVGSSRRDS